MSSLVKLRSIYRSFLRELPRRPLAEISHSPLHQRVRNTLSTTDAETPVELASQFLQYFRAQRVYVTLLEKYNPGMNMDEEERVRLTARRVGMELPLQFQEPRSVKDEETNHREPNAV
ncbi:hypothetical protein K3495_g11854 [Podosphaera aphanis]|nr:hypothetical protein K3495_g11854 [Podosphaera aphanis]